MNRNLDLLKHANYLPYGSCIYCGAKTNLSREHIVPKGLGGDGTLPNSSCKSCAAVTGQFERKVLRGAMREVRSHLKLSSRRRKERITTADLIAIRGGKEIELELATHEHPLLFIMPQFAPPSLVTGNHVKGINIRGFYTYNVGKPVNQVLEDLDAEDFRVTRTYDMSSFARMLAKIGWAFCAAERRLGELDPEQTVLDAFMRNPTNIGRWVGCYTDPIKRESVAGHIITLRSDQVYQYADIQLFSDFGTPKYGVIVGKLRKI